MTSLLMYLDDVLFDLSQVEDMEQLRQLVDEGGVLFWSMNGLLGKLPNAVLIDALRLYDATQAATERSRYRMYTIDAPWVIHWSQTVTPQDHRAALEHPLLRLTQP